jgi:type II secretory ATPase GspE/PulE/Tfp pilus assembly ATPase PilB-like protein
MNVCLKIMAGLDIGETRRPQGGGFQRLMNGHHVDFRVATHPTVYGESIVVRILDKDKAPLSLHQLGFGDNHIQLFKKLIHQPQGIIIFSGPTGSGKTTTLYALFSEMDRDARNIVTLEQPVEYHLPGVRQTEIREGVISFQEGLRSVLRQDPDVIFIGEIRDEETAHMALRSAMTGHLVFATLHTNDAASVPARLVDLGLSPTLLSGNILAAVAQRLLRCVCQCETKGCDECSQTGYSGRVAVAEILPFDDDVNHIIAAGANVSDLRAYVYHKKIPTLKDDANNKKEKGITTQEEIHRVLGQFSVV